MTSFMMYCVKFGLFWLASFLVFLPVYYLISNAGVKKVAVIGMFISGHVALILFYAALILFLIKTGVVI